MNENAKRFALKQMLLACDLKSRTGRWAFKSDYPNCEEALIKAGLATRERKITLAGLMALFLLDEGPNPITDQDLAEDFR